MRHYVEVTDREFERAKRWRPSGVGENVFPPCGQKYGQDVAKNAAKQAEAAESTEEKFLTQPLAEFQVTPSFSNPFGIVQTCPLEAAGIEPASRNGSMLAWYMRSRFFESDPSKPPADKVLSGRASLGV